jgi:2-methylisocitrate lyase-like PEP mutase family enzyme
MDTKPTKDLTKAASQLRSLHRPGEPLRYLDAGADCVYPIRLTDPLVARAVVEQLDGPVNANLGPNVTVADLAAAGVSRISIGPTAFRSALATVDRIAADLLG